MAEKVCLQPCLGLRRESVLCRQAFYVVHEDLRPETTVLGCGPALNANVQEDVDFINMYPVLAAEACEKDCATKLVARRGSGWRARSASPSWRRSSASSSPRCRSIT